MTVIRPNSVSGITSITAQANEINFFRSNGTLAGLQLNGVNHHTSSGVSTFHTVNVLGNLDVAGVLTYQDVTNVDSLGIGTFRTGINVSGGQLDVGSNIKLGNAGVITATSFVGSGANLTGINADLVNDSSPQLGGDLDVNGNAIVSTSNANIAITPNGSGKVVIDGISHPTADGTNGQALVTNGSGVLSFSTISSGGGGGATGGGSDEIFYENDQTVTTNYSISASHNAVTAGPITVNNGVTITVPSGVRWVVV